MATTAIESSKYLVGIGVQPAQGTAITEPDILARHVTGGFTVNNEEFTEQWSDGRRASTPVQGKGKVTGTGGPGLQATPRLIHYLFTAIGGADTVGSVDTNGLFPHTCTDAESVNVLGVFTDIGEGVQQTLRHNDGRQTQLVLTAGVSTRVARITPSFLFLDPAEQVAEVPDPVIDDLLTEPWANTDLEGTITIPEINGGDPLTDVVSALTFTVTDNVTDYQGMGYHSGAFIPGRLNCSLELTLLLTGDTLEAWNLYQYGTTTPSVGAKPTKKIFKGGPLQFTFTDPERFESNEFTIPDAIYSITGDISGQPDGGAIELTLTATSIPGPVGDSFQLVSHLQEQDSYASSPIEEAPINTVAPTITGTAQEGQVLTSHNGTWTDDGSPTFTKQWKIATTSGGTYSNISGATGSTYTPVTGDVGKFIKVVITNTDGGGSTSSISSATLAVIAA